MSDEISVWSTDPIGCRRIRGCLMKSHALALTVMGVIVLRVRRPELPRPYRTWGYPVTPLVFLAMSAFMMFYIMREKPMEALWGLGTLVVGGLLYVVARLRQSSVVGDG